MNEKQISENEEPDERRDKLNQWRRANPLATLTEIEEAVEAELAKIRNEWVTALAQVGEESQQDAPHCPERGRAMVKNGRRKRQLKGKEGQTIELERQQWRCLGCGATLFPAG